MKLICNTRNRGGDEQNRRGAAGNVHKAVLKWVTFLRSKVPRVVRKCCVENNNARAFKKSKLAVERHTPTNECGAVSRFRRGSEHTPAHVVADPAVAAEQDGAPRQAVAGKGG